MATSITSFNETLEGNELCSEHMSLQRAIEQSLPVYTETAQTLWSEWYFCLSLLVAPHTPDSVSVLSVYVSVVNVSVL